jgi:small conductance mechanosensitive channel
MLLVLVSAPLVADAQVPIQLLSAAGQVAEPATQPAATQPAAAQVSSSGSATAPSATPQPSGSASDAFGKTKFMELFRGQKTLTPQEAMKLDFWLSAGKEMLFAAVGFIPRVFVAGLFLLVFWGIHRAVRRMVISGMSRANVDDSIRDMLGHLIKWAVMGFGLVIAFNQVGVQITAMLTGISILGLAIGFAAQDAISNFISGVVIFWDKPFKVGDWIQIQDVYARVARITFRSTRLHNEDGDIVVYPNTAMLANKIANHSADPVTRVNVPILIPYKDSIDDARAKLLALVSRDGRIMTDPTPTVVVNTADGVNVGLVLRFWVKDESLERVLRGEFLERAKNALFPPIQLTEPSQPSIAA